MTAASIPFTLAFMLGSEALDATPCMGWFQVNKFICAFFISYCLMDLGMGYFLYPSEMNPWSGYFHHTLYTFMVTNLVQRNLGSSFVIFGLLEAPTLLMAAGSIHKPLRHDNLFGAVFFSTRLVFHVYLTAHIAFYAFPWTFTLMYPLCVLPLHVMWFNGWLKQQKRIRMKKAKLASAVPTLTSDMSSSSTSTTPILPPRLPSPSTLLTRLEAYRTSMLQRRTHSRPHRAISSPNSDRRSSISSMTAAPESRRSSVSKVGGPTVESLVLEGMNGGKGLAVKGDARD
ncbi:hypothetical protein HDU97_000755 [Phlyctochytrium planicorne]|nr:hypothetical protein HDU97_000755 [Phlyctochytrium planicorne]